MPRLDLINMKLNHVLRPMVRDLKRNRTVIARIGGHTTQTMGEEVAFQEGREQNLLWARAATDDAIRQRIRDLEATLTAEERALKYGIVRGLSLETVGTVAQIEDLELALGIHPALGVR